MNEVSTNSVAVKYGIILTIGLVVYTAVLYFADLFTNQALGYVSYLIIILTLVLAYRDYKSQTGGYMKFGQGIGIAAVMLLIATGINSIFSYVYISFIDPGFTEKMKQMTYETLEKQNMPPEQIEAAMEMSSWSTSAGFIAVAGFFGTFIIGLIIALVVSAIMKNNPPEEFYE